MIPPTPPLDRTRSRPRPEPKCPLRPDEVCNLCQLNVTGPQDCGLVYLVMSDPDQRIEWGERRRNRGADRPAQPSHVIPADAGISE